MIQRYWIINVLCKSDSVDDMKPQGIITKVATPDSHANAKTDSNIDFFFFIQNILHLKMSTIVIQMMLIWTLVELVTMKTQKMT